MSYFHFQEEYIEIDVLKSMIPNWITELNWTEAYKLREEKLVIGFICYKYV